MKLLAERGNGRRWLVEVQPGLAMIFDTERSRFVGKAKRPDAFLKFGYWSEPTERALSVFEAATRPFTPSEPQGGHGGRSVTSEGHER